MSEKDYQRILEIFHQKPDLEKIMHLMIHYSPYPDIVIYICLLSYLWLTRSPEAVKCTLIPAAVLVITTILRKLINAPRPYDLYQISPLDDHDPGESFPSRHTSSAFAIGYCCLYYYSPLGIIAIIIALIVAFTRIIGGLHFPKDVLSGFLLATVLSLFYYL